MQPSRPPLSAHQRTLLFAAGATALIWAVPGLSRLFIPVEYLNTYLHELCHALVGLLTGADVGLIKIFNLGGGVTLTAGGSPFLIASAGYVGSTVIGATVILLSRTEAGARFALRLVAGLVALTLVAWVRGEVIGVSAGVAWIAVAVAASTLRDQWLLFVAQFVGLQQCLGSFLSLATLVQVSADAGVQSDAMLLQQMTGVPAVVWSVFWVILSLAVVTVVLRKTWAPHPGPVRPGAGPKWGP